MARSEYLTVTSRDPYGRGDHVRDTEESARTCSWCGRRRPSGRLFRYGVWTDGGRMQWDRALFCSIGCRREYHA